MDYKVRTGIIGLGFMGATHLNIYRENPGVRVVAIADVDLKKRQGDISAVVANISGGDNSQNINLEGVRVYADGMDLIADPDIDLIDICLPGFLHKKFALAAIASGKHVFCEKPLAMTVSDAAELVAAAKRSGKIFMVGMCVRFWPEYRYVREQYKAGNYGRIRQAFFKRFSPTVSGNGWNNWFAEQKMSGGALLEMHLHDVDQMLYFFGRPQRVTATGCRGMRSQDCWDHVFCFYDFGNGFSAVAEGGWTAAKGTPFEMNFQLICDDATVIFNHAGLNIYYEDGHTEKPNLSSFFRPTGWHEEIDYLIDTILYGGTADKYMALDELTDGISIVEAERASLECGLPVTVKYMEA